MLAWKSYKRTACRKNKANTEKETMKAERETNLQIVIEIETEREKQTAKNVPMQ